MKTRKQQHYKPRRGFTLIELMIVVVILGLLATIILFKTENGRFPTTAEGLQALVTNPGNLPDYDPDGYLEKVPLDPWKHSFIYISPGVHSKDYDLLSYGKDGESGGMEYDADIESWNLDER